MYQLHRQLAQDTHHIGQYELCDVLLMNDARYPWVILVPRVANIRELHELSEEQQQRLMRESSFTAKAMLALFSADKMNVAALGNMVEQLHLHHVARFTTDATWPKPVWGVGDTEPYSDVAAKVMLSQCRQALDEFLVSA
jgi:diadenosine tetraphosphate (Ap4A) HIT family hydrolase